ncbi:MAG: GNAT family N-acetyltransferase, partial [Chloroflexi bacterium]|nr:GNAT family N-acetyltransferase [Chloroflexota bacterium]
KVYYHWMPGLPGADPALDLSLSRMLFEDERFRPDGLKIYPTMVIAGTELERWHREGRYRPYGRDELVALVAGIKAAVPRYARIARVLRDIPTDYIEAGCRDSLRGLVKDYLARHGLECRCVRCREFGHRARLGYDIGEPRLARLDYEASGGKEIFLSFEDERETLFGLLRLRIQPLAAPVPGAAGSAALVRELHVFGPEVPLSEKRVGAAQHRGLGRALLQEAERIAAAEFGLDDIAVLSGAGARGYYREAGYELDGHYMVKRLQPALLAGRPF